MNFIEQIFGISPDGGNGLFEFFMLLVLFVAVAVPVVRRVKRFVTPRWNLSRQHAVAKPFIIF